MHNNDLKHAFERDLILSSTKGVVTFAGEVEVDNDDENGYFTITQKYCHNNKHKTRIIKGQLLIGTVEED